MTNKEIVEEMKKDIYRLLTYIESSENILAGNICRKISHSADIILTDIYLNGETNDKSSEQKKSHAYG